MSQKAIATAMGTSSTPWACVAGCAADADADGICDDDDCVGEYDALGVGNGGARRLTMARILRKSSGVKTLLPSFDATATEDDGNCNYDSSA